jgi:hypothetical protein
MGIRRMCFDTENGAFLSPVYGFGTEDGIREYFRDRSVRFDCGVVYDVLRRRYCAFREAGKMVAMLSRADELISFNGKRWDFIMLEKQVGPDCVDRSLRRIHHHDLLGWQGRYELRALARSVMPKEEMERLDDYQQYDGHYNGLGFGEFLSGRLSKCRCDVQLTYAVFRRYEAALAQKSGLHPQP